MRDDSSMCVGLVDGHVLMTLLLPLPFRLLCALLLLLFFFFICLNIFQTNEYYYLFSFPCNDSHVRLQCSFHALCLDDSATQLYFIGLPCIQRSCPAESNATMGIHSTMGLQIWARIWFICYFRRKAIMMFCFFFRLP